MESEQRLGSQRGAETGPSRQKPSPVPPRPGGVPWLHGRCTPSPELPASRMAPALCDLVLSHQPRQQSSTARGLGRRTHKGPGTQPSSGTDPPAHTNVQNRVPRPAEQQEANWAVVQHRCCSVLEFSWKQGLAAHLQPRPVMLEKCVNLMFLVERSLSWPSPGCRHSQGSW